MQTMRRHSSSRCALLLELNLDSQQRVMSHCSRIHRHTLTRERPESVAVTAKRMGASMQTEVTCMQVPAASYP